MRLIVLMYHWNGVGRIIIILVSLCMELRVEISWTLEQDGHV